MKKLFVVIALLAGILCGCSTNAVKNMSAEETVRYCFEQFSLKNQTAMGSVIYEKHRDVEYELENLISVDLISAEEETDISKIDFNSAWYEGEPYQVAMLYVVFDIEYENGGGAGFDNGRYDWRFYLVKDSEDSDWMIVMWGV